ncbi:cold shock domain-containing protein [Baaleninema sp.]|uniref:cold shock domain-containing protein n=1 Tax=Baaleninema sp. TaxID=3101197 RepID=UPI003D07ACE0
MKSSRQKGKLIHWQDERGFGFVRPDDGTSEIFLHISEFKNLHRRPKVGDILYYKTIRKKGKLRAIQASIDGDPQKVVKRSRDLKSKSKK